MMVIKAVYCLLLLGAIVGLILTAPRNEVKEMKVRWAQHVNVEAPTPTPTPKSVTLYVWFNFKAQSEYLAKSPKVINGKPVLLFYYSFIKGKAAEEGDSTVLVKCQFSKEYVEGLITKQYHGEIEIQSDQCWELKP